MSWNLNAEIEVELKELQQLLAASINFFGGDVDSVALKIVQKQQSECSVLLDTTVGYQAGLAEAVSHILWVNHDLDRLPWFEIFIDVGIDLLIQDSEGATSCFLIINVSKIEDTFICSLRFGDSDAYQRSGTPLVSGHSQIPLTLELVLTLLEHLCNTVKPKSLYLYTGERGVVPWEHHLIFHADPGGYSADVNEFLDAQLETLLDPATASSVDTLSKIQKMFDYLYKNTFAFSFSTKITLADLAQIWAESADTTFKTFVAGESLGIYATPFLEGDCLLPYWLLIRHLAISNKLAGMTEQKLSELLAEPTDEERGEECLEETPPCPPMHSPSGHSRKGGAEPHPSAPTLPLGLNPIQRVDAIIRELAQPDQCFITNFNLVLGDQVAISPILDRFGRIQGLSLGYGPQAHEVDLREYLQRLVAYQNLIEQRRVLRSGQHQLQDWLNRHKQPFVGSVASKIQEQINQLADTLLQQQEQWEEDRLKSLSATELNAQINQATPLVQAQLTLCERLECAPSFGFLESAILDHELVLGTQHLDSLRQFFDHPDQRSNPHLKALIPSLAEAAEVDAPYDIDVAMSQFFAHYYLAKPTPAEPLSLLSLDPTQPLQLKLDSATQPWQIRQSPATSPTHSAGLITAADGLPQISRFEISPQLERTYHQTLAQYRVKRPSFAELASDLLLQHVVECLLISKLYPNRPLVLAPHQPTPYSSLALRWGGIQPDNSSQELLPQVWQVTAARAKEANIWVMVTFGTASQPLRVIEGGQGARLQEGSRAYLEHALDQMSADKSDVAQQVAAQLRNAWELQVLRYLYFRVHLGPGVPQIRGVEQWSFSLRS